MSDAAAANALKIVAWIDAGKPFDEIADLVVPDAAFSCQCDALKDVTTVKGWSEWMTHFEANICPQCKATVHSTAYDASTKTFHYFATFYAKHTGEGGPCPATHKETNSEYYCALVMNEEGKCTKFTKVWNDGFALKELGWC